MTFAVSCLVVEREENCGNRLLMVPVFAVVFGVGREAVSGRVSLLCVFRLFPIHGIYF